MKENRVSFIGLIILLTMIGILVTYLGLGFYYRYGFSYGTWINGIYCTGKSVEEVNAELVSQTDISNLSIISNGETISAIDLSQIDYSVDYTKQLKKYIKKQNPILWIDNITFSREHTLEPEVAYDKYKLKNVISMLDFVVKANLTSKEVYIHLTDNGYELYNGMEHVLDVTKLSTCIEGALKTRQMEIDIDQMGCYTELDLTKEMQETIEIYQQIVDFQSCDIIYDMGDLMLPISAGITAKWILLDEEGGFALDNNGQIQLREEGITEFVVELAKEYDTYGSTRVFHATRGEDVSIEGGTYGNKLDQKAEITYLKAAFTNKSAETHIPSYTKEALVRGKEDIGPTYIEIDMTSQKMYYYQEGEMKIETDIVTGNMKRKWGTPSGVNFVYAKQKNRVLRGEGYASPVKFWMPVKDRIGIHDASWRSEFGGDIYLKGGSHGCINTPTDIMRELYDMVEVGTPVVMFY